jgi:hypothetical protein
MAAYREIFMAALGPTETGGSMRQILPISYGGEEKPSRALMLVVRSESHVDGPADVCCGPRASGGRS